MGGLGKKEGETFEEICPRGHKKYKLVKLKNKYFALKAQKAGPLNGPVFVCVRFGDVFLRFKPASAAGVLKGLSVKKTKPQADAWGFVVFGKIRAVAL